MWLGVEKPYKTTYMLLYLHGVIKPSKILCTQDICMVIGNLSTFPLKSTRGMGMPEGLCRREGVKSFCCVSGYCGAILSYDQVSYLWISWREPLVYIGERAMQLYSFLFPDKPNRGVGLSIIVVCLINPLGELA